MHPSAHLKIEVEQLRRELAELKALIAPPAPAAPKPETSRPASVPIETPEEFDARWHAERIRREAEHDAREAKAREGLPAGFYRDPCGLVRTSDGVLAAKVEREIDEANAVMDRQAAQHRAFKRRNRITTDETETDQ